MELRSPVGVAKFFVYAQCFFQMFQPPGTFALPTHKLAQAMMEIGVKVPVPTRFFKQLEGRAPMRKCLLICKDTPRFVARSTQVTDGLFCDPSLTEAMRQFGKVRGEIGGVDLLERFTDGAMKPRTLRVSRAFVERLADKWMSEAIALAGCGRDDDHFGRLTHQLRQRFGVQLANSPEQRRVEFLPDDSGDRQN